MKTIVYFLAFILMKRERKSFVIDCIAHLERHAIQLDIVSTTKNIYHTPRISTIFAKYFYTYFVPIFNEGIKTITLKNLSTQ